MSSHLDILKNYMDPGSNTTSSFASVRSLPTDTASTPIPDEGDQRRHLPSDPEKGSTNDSGVRLPSPSNGENKKGSWSVQGCINLFRGDGALRPLRLLKSDLKGRPRLYRTDWFFNQLILASAVYVFFTNLLPGITFASDLFALTGGNYGTIEVVFSTGICGIIFAL